MKNFFCLSVSFLIGLFFVLQPWAVKAQDTLAQQNDSKPVIEYVNGSKYIYVDRLHFSPNMTIWEMLRLFPELMARGSQDVLNSYSIVMDDYSLGNNRDEVLYQMTIGELSMIIISESPSVAYAKNGIGGTITLVPKSLKEGVSGNAQLDVSTEKCVLASANINYKKDKLRIRSYIKGEFMDYLEKYTLNLTGSTLYSSYDFYDQYIGATELAKLSLEYSASDKDELSFAIWETYGFQNTYQNEIINAIHTGSHYDTARTSGIGTLARFTYGHKFNANHNFSIGINYSFAQKAQNEFYSDMGYTQPHEVSSDIRYNGNLVHKDRHTLKMVTGLDFSYNLSKSGKPSEYNSSYLHLSPLLEFRYTLKDKLFVRMGSRYHYDSYKDFDSEDAIAPGHDYMVSGEIAYTPVQGHTLRLSGVRDRICSSIGHNAGYLSSGDLSYIFQKQINSHYVNVTGGFLYDHVLMLSGQVYNIYAAKAGITWQHRWFCLSFTSHLYDNATYHEEVEDYHLYYNLRLTPIFTLPKDWSISANFLYNSPMTSSVVKSGGYFYTSLRVSKQIGKWSIHAELSDPFHYRTTDLYFFSEDDMLNNMPQNSNTYNPYRRYLNMGVMYSF